MEFPDFKNLEEVKEFISSTDSSRLGAIHFADESGKSVTMKMDEFIEKFGLDAAAQFIYDNSENMMKFAMTGKELRELLTKAKNDPNSLTDEEKMMIVFALQNCKNEKSYDICHEVITIFIKALLDIGKDVTENYDGLLAVCITLLGGLLVLSSDKLSVYSRNMNMYREVVKSIEEQIIIPEGIDDTLLLATLINIIGKRYLENKTELKNTKCDYKSFAETLGLDTEFLFESDSFDEKSTKDETNNNEKSGKVDLSALEKTKDNGSIINLDIRKKLKEDKK